MTPSEIIDAFGGVAKIAGITNSAPGAVRNWKRTGIPAKFWIPLLDLARQKRLSGVTREAIMWRPAKLSKDASE